MDRRRATLIAIAAAFVVAVVVGAYLDWSWWQPYSGLTITLAAFGLLGIALILVVPRRSRGAGVVTALVAAGLLLGQNLGPSRPTLRTTEGSVTVALTAPRASEGTAAATCSMDGDATELQVSGDPNLRLDVIPDDPAVPADIDQRESMSLHLAVGDRWHQGPAPRTDATVLQVILGRVEADEPETRMASGPASTLELSWDATGGTLSFAGLVHDTSDPGATGDPIDLTGTVTWTCAQAPT